MFASHRSQSSRIFLTPITLLNPENTIKLTSNTTFKNIKSLYIDNKLASFGEKRDDKPNLPEAKVVKRTVPNSEASIFSQTCYLDEVSDFVEPSLCLIRLTTHPDPINVA